LRNWGNLLRLWRGEGSTGGLLLLRSCLLHVTGTNASLVVIPGGGGFFRRFRKIGETDYWLRYVCLSLSVHPHGTTRLPLDRISRNFTFEYPSQICREKPSFIKTGQDYWPLYITTYLHLRSYLAEFFLE